MKKNILIIVLFSFISVYSFAQQEATDSTGIKVKDYPVSAVFESGYLIDAQTTVIPDVKTLEFSIQHKFGSIEKNGRSDLWGIYGSSNIRLGLDYVLVKNLQVGAGITKRYTTTDVNAKWTILQQTRKNTIPVSVALYGNIAVDGTNRGGLDTIREAYTGPINAFKFSDRLSYFSEIIISRKFCKEFSLQAGISFIHYNAVLEVNNRQTVGGYDHDKIGVHVSGRIKVSPQGSIVFNYDQPLKIQKISEQIKVIDSPKPNLALGYEVSTGTHAFQIYMGSTSSLLPQDNIMYNQNDWQNKGLALGFTITRLWGF